MGTKIELSFIEQIKILLDRDGKTMAELAAKLGTTRQNLHNKFVRNKLNEQEMEQIANAAGYRLTITLEPLEKPLSNKGVDK